MHHCLLCLVHKKLWDFQYTISGGYFWCFDVNRHCPKSPDVCTIFQQTKVIEMRDYLKRDPIIWILVQQSTPALPLSINLVLTLSNMILMFSMPLFSCGHKTFHKLGDVFGYVCMDKIVCRVDIMTILQVVQKVKSSPPSAIYASVNRVSIGLDNSLSPIRHRWSKPMMAYCQ